MLILVLKSCHHAQELRNLQPAGCPESIIIGGTADSLGRGLSSQTSLQKGRSLETCACSLIVAGHTYSSDLEKFFQGSCRAAGNQLGALRRLGLEKVTVIITQVC